MQTDRNPVSYQAQQPQQHRSVVSGSHQESIFEFKKRKKWDNLLLSELHLSFTLILSPYPSNSKILFIGYNTAIDDVLGYKEEDLIDSDFGDIMHEQDWKVWQSLVNDAIHSKSSGTIGMFARLKRNKNQGPSTFHSTWPAIPSPSKSQSTQEVLFEIRGHVHYINSPKSLAEGHTKSEPACVLATATPYPSTATEALNSFLEHKVKHERLLQRVRELKASGPTNVSNSEASSSDLPSLPHQTSTHQAGTATSTLPHPISVPPTSNYSASYYNSPTHETDLISTSSSITTDHFPPSTNHISRPIPHATLEGNVDENDESNCKKKSKKGPQQYVCVTCGRTDSPEWRKGPQGPKTLCNACGLRWAKKARKVDGPPNTHAPGPPDSSVFALCKEAYADVGIVKYLTVRHSSRYNGVRPW